MDECWSDSCLICGKKFYSEAEMKVHIEEVHMMIHKKEESNTLQCPFCQFTIDQPDNVTTELENHVRNVHENDMKTPKKDECVTTQKINGECSNNLNQTTDSELRFCPVCGMTGFDTTDALSLHTETHFIDENDEMPMASNYAQDELLAIRLQQQERFEQTANKEMAEKLYFEELRDRYGMGKEHQRTGFRNQAFKNMDKQAGRSSASSFDYYSNKLNMLEKLEMGIDDGMTICSDVYETLESYLEKSLKSKTRIWIASHTYFIGRGPGDSGWGCGYRNIQMLISNLNKNSRFKEFMQQKFDGNIPSIPKLQETIESAWSEGYDVRGKEQLESKVVGTRKWIGATEAFTLFSSLGLHCRIIDFPRPSGPKRGHPLLLNWIVQYFNCEDTKNNNVFVTSKPPLYLQHEGHSKTIIGIMCEDGRNLNPVKILVFDPGDSKFQLKKKITKSGTSQKSLKEQLNFNKFIKPVSCLNKEQYQVVSIEKIASFERMQQQKNVDSICEKVQ